MTKNIYFVGIDIAAYNFVASVYQSPKQPVTTKEGFENTIDGFNFITLTSSMRSKGVINGINSMSPPSLGEQRGRDNLFRAINFP